MVCNEQSARLAVYTRVITKHSKHRNFRQCNQCGPPLRKKVDSKWTPMQVTNTEEYRKEGNQNDVLCISLLCSCVRASWINVNNCPTRCDFVQFLFPANCSTYFGWYIHPSSGARINCNYSIWHWSNLTSAVVEESGLSPGSSMTAEDSIRFDQCQML
jgi:hypothetical protein